MTTVHDDALTTLARALAPGAFDDIRAACVLPAITTSASVSSSQVIKHAQGKRATILYSFADQTEAPERLVGKLYRSGRRAARMHRWLSALESDVFLKTDRIRVPQPLGLSGALHMLLYDYVDGVDLRHAVDDNKPFALAAHWLARLHDARPLAELKVRTIQHDVAKSIQWIKAVQPALSASNGTRLARMHNLLERLPTTPPDELRMIHRDYYYANLLWDGSSLWALDIDQLRLGEPALDVAHFSAHLQVLAYRQTGDFAAYDEQMHHFLNTYRQARPTGDAFGRLPFYTAYTFLKLAATEVDRARDGWRDAAEVFAARACDALDGRA